MLAHTFRAVDSEMAVNLFGDDLAVVTDIDNTVVRDKSGPGNLADVTGRIFACLTLSPERM